MLTKVQKWGNSIAVRIPKAFVDEMQIAAESEVELTMEEGKLIIAPVESPVFSLEELLAGITPENLHEAGIGASRSGKKHGEHELHARPRRRGLDELQSTNRARTGGPAARGRAFSASV